MRRASGYTFTAEKDALREFRIEATPGLTARAVIGNVVVSSQTRDRSGPIAITYTLSSEANTTIRILGGNGREVFTVTRGRADRAGENSVLWALRDNQNRSVAPGSYQVEITAETTDGERVRRFVPVNVIR
jgi:flagellar hook assembly protein FlgD